MNASSDPALAARGLGKQYHNSAWALRAVDLEVPSGSVTALVGPNGAGKSTLMKAWVGFERPTEGTVAVLGIDPWRHRREAVGKTAYLAQVPSLYRDLTAGDHVLLAASLRPGFDAARARERLRILDIPQGSRAWELSGGQQAQLGLAIALGTRSPVLLLDEPLASLDPLARLEFLEVLIQGVQEDGATVVLSSHILAEIESVCDRLVVLAGGRVLLDATVAHATTSYAVVRPSELRTGNGMFLDGPLGEPLVLIERDSGAPGTGRDATLEEVVIGLLSAGRTRHREG